jgi:hypothetical protein
LRALPRRPGAAVARLRAPRARPAADAAQRGARRDGAGAPEPGAAGPDGALVPDVERRFSVPPGITGLAQLSGDSEEDIAGLVRRAAHDLDYVERRSPWLDLGILLRTVAYVIAPPSAAQHARPRSAAPVRH